MSYKDRWERAISGTTVGKNKTETVLSFIIAFKEAFDGNGPVLEEIGEALSRVYEIVAPDKKIASYYINRLIKKGLIETAKLEGEASRSPGRILLKRGQWSLVCREGADKELAHNKDYESFTRTISKQDSVQPDRDLVGETSVL